MVGGPVLFRHLLRREARVAAPDALTAWRRVERARRVGASRERVERCRGGAAGWGGRVTTAPPPQHCSYGVVVGDGVEVFVFVGLLVDVLLPPEDGFGFGASMPFWTSSRTSW